MTTKNTTLASLGVLPANSSLAQRTCQEYAMRYLIKSNQHMSEALLQSKVVNFTFDAAFVAEEHAASS